MYQEKTISKGRRKDKILDAAEKLFADHGFDGVTLRQIADEAGVDLALASYHFGNKLGLFDAALTRRAEFMNKVRLDVLNKCIEESGPQGPDIETLMEISIRPVLDPDMPLTDGWRNYLRLVAYVNNSGQWGRDAMTKYFEPVLKAYLEAWKRALPKAKDEDLYWCYHFFSGALTLSFAQTGRIDHYSKGLCKSTDLQAACKRMIPFMAAGFKALCDPEGEDQTQNKSIMPQRTKIYLD
ncbi:TetR family transcriptional regulator [Kordiimonas sediminis]|uniref:TetR family transcriptional regulator n=1 Tax=Kordiimonas sediminis TaxID=1735581 RepID=A0A919E983_9PROT|nr:TetR/AcrR family transcriptional regulator [Kordiimonas sediminis]GHF26999.1 TetR family transcriptional regulator [Kordiimonas sediminis]